MHTLVIGAGFSGSRIALLARECGTVSATRRNKESLHALQQNGISSFVLDGALDEVLREELRRATHLIICVPPERQAPLRDPVHDLLAGLHREDIPSLVWIAYLSTIGVYGDHAGAWVDEDSECLSVQPRSQMRRAAEVAWQSFADLMHIPLCILRLSGIYGPGRNALEDAIKGKARLLIKPGQVFNRIHVDDIAQATLLAARLHYAGIVNITDDLPAPPQDVVRFAHNLVNKPCPPEQEFATADLSDMARSFYSENKRVSNKRSKLHLQMTYQHPNYESGLEALLKLTMND
ncbi:MAG: SDR family oxidoreductase [Granulosicoccus sp.]